MQEQAIEEAYRHAVGFLSSALRFGIHPSLEGITALAHALGDPQSRYVSLQVAGTNGKSSTSRILAALLAAEGFRVGLFTSPELVEYPERFEVDGEVISHATFAHIIDEVERTAACIEETTDGPIGICGGKQGAVGRHDADGDTGGIRYTQNREEYEVAEGDEHVFTEFEYLTAAALKLFADEGVDFAVFEVGLGGRWDATSIVDPAVATICGIGFDHQGILGDTLEQIAAEKAAIIKPASAVVLGPGTVEVQQVFMDRVRACDTYARAVCPGDDDLFPGIPAELTVRYDVCADAGGLGLDIRGCHATYNDLLLPDAPVYQAANVASAVAAAEAALGRALSTGCVRRALRNVVFPGRFETLSTDPLLIIDGAHNPQSARVLADAIDRRFEGADKPMLLLAVLSDKDAGGIIDELAPHVASIAVTSSASSRAIPYHELAEMVGERTGAEPLLYPNVMEAVESLVVNGDGTPVVASGSITLAGEIKGLFG